MHSPISLGQDAPKHKRPRPSVQPGLPPGLRVCKAWRQSRCLYLTRPAALLVSHLACAPWALLVRSCVARVARFIARSPLSICLVSLRRDPLSLHCRPVPFSPRIRCSALACGLDPLCAFHPPLFWKPVCVVTACRAKPCHKLHRFREGRIEQDGRSLCFSNSFVPGFDLPRTPQPAYPTVHAVPAFVVSQPRSVP
ncbi:hypothetical protein LY76DRAFT_123820 [Colletotrichum caudatum]|nr:hypothetical protein LY76DRAFT_123820 [Colletotrichum caudatum]